MVFFFFCLFLLILFGVGIPISRQTPLFFASILQTESSQVGPLFAFCCQPGIEWIELILARGIKARRNCVAFAWCIFFLCIFYAFSRSMATTVVASAVAVSL